VPAKVPLEDAAVLGAVEDGAPVLELTDAIRSFLRVELGHAPVIELLPAEHRVAEVDLPGVLGIHVRERCRHAPLGHHRVCLAEERLADHAGARAGGGRLDRGAEPRAAGADHQHIEVVRLEPGGVHRSLTSWMTPIARSRTTTSAIVTAKSEIQAKS
jgi:hypothetical protein